MEAEVTFQPSGKRARVPKGTTILEAARQVGLPVASGCDSHGLCARCGVTVLEGGRNVSKEQLAESEAKRVNRIDPEQRLACMTTIRGDLVVTAFYW